MIPFFISNLRDCILVPYSETYWIHGDYAERASQDWMLLPVVVDLCTCVLVYFMS